VLDARKGSAATTIVATREGEGEGEGEAEKDLGHAKEGGTKATVTPANGHSMSPTSPESDDGDDDDSHEKEPDRAELQRVFVRASWISGIMALIITIVSDPCSCSSNHLHHLHHPQLISSRRIQRIPHSCRCTPPGTATAPANSR
jgi:hypothetical protein